MKTFSALLAICAGNSPVSGEFPAQRPVTRSFDVLIVLRLNKRLSKQSWGWWFETLSCPLWRLSNVTKLTLLLLLFSSGDRFLSFSSYTSVCCNYIQYTYLEYILHIWWSNMTYLYFLHRVQNCMKILNGFLIGTPDKRHSTNLFIISDIWTTHYVVIAVR